MKMNEFRGLLEQIEDAYKGEHFAHIDYRRILVSIITGEINALYYERRGELWLFTLDADKYHMNFCADLNKWDDETVIEVLDVGKQGYF